MFAAESRGELKKGTARRWAHETKNIKKLPEHVKKEYDDEEKTAAFMFGLSDEISKLASHTEEEILKKRIKKVKKEKEEEEEEADEEEEKGEKLKKKLEKMRGKC